jgi:hypothetical protein
LRDRWTLSQDFHFNLLDEVSPHTHEKGNVDRVQLEAARNRRVGQTSCGVSGSWKQGQ